MSSSPPPPPRVAGRGRRAVANLAGLLVGLVSSLGADASHAAIFRVIAYREFGSTTTISSGTPGFDPAASDITVSGDELEHPDVRWNRSTHAQFIDIYVTGSGNKRYFVSGDLAQPVRVGDCVGDPSPSQYCGTNSGLRFGTPQTVRVKLVTGELALVEIIPEPGTVPPTTPSSTPTRTSTLSPTYTPRHTPTRTATGARTPTPTPPGSGEDCCTPHDSPGCKSSTCAACVCAADDFCCDPAGAWDNTCVEVAEQNCPLSCGCVGTDKPDVIAVRAYLRTGPNSGSEVTSPLPGQTVYLHVDWTLEDDGNATIDVPVRAVLDGSVYCGGTYPAEPGATIWVACATGWTATSGRHVLTWELDYSDVIDESDESNNEVSIEWTSGGVGGIPGRTSALAWLC